MKTPTTKQILAEADKLEIMKPTVRKESLFHDDHHRAIDAQVEVLRDFANGEGAVDEDEVRANFEDNGDQDGVVEAAIQAFLWADGSEDFESEYGATPSANWQSLVRK